MIMHGTLVALGARPLATVHGDFAVHVFRNLLTRDCALALARGDLGGPEPLLARVHSSCMTSESWGGCDCDCAQQLDAALAHIAAAGRGVVFYLMQEGRGAGFLAKARDRMIVQASRNRLTTFDAYAEMGLAADCRRYDEVAMACRLLGITAPLALLTNNPDKTRALEAAGLAIAGVRPLRHPASPFNVQYLKAKSQVGHALPAAGVRAVAASLPEAVSRLEPRALAHAPHLVHVASYLLPVALGEGDRMAGPHWFRAHAYFDGRAGRPRVVLSYGAGGGGALLVRLQAETLLERFPMRDGGTHRRRWDATVRAFVGAGAGCAVFATRDDVAAEPASPSPDVAADETAVELVAHHAGGRRIRPVLAAGEMADEPRLRHAFERRGIAADAAALLGGVR